MLLIPPRYSLRIFNSLSIMMSEDIWLGFFTVLKTLVLGTLLTDTVLVLDKS